MALDPVENANVKRIVSPDLATLTASLKPKMFGLNQYDNTAYFMRTDSAMVGYAPVGGDSEFATQKLTGLSGTGDNISIDASGNLYKSVGGLATSNTVLMDYIGTPNNTTLQNWSDNTQSAGILSGGDLTDDGAGGVNVSEINGIIKTTNDPNGDNVFFEIAAQTSVALTNESVNYVSVDYNSGTPQIITSVTNTSNGHTIFNLGKVFREGTSLDILDSGLNVYDFAKRVQQRHVEVSGLSFVSGARVSETGTRNISISAGVLYAGINRILTDAIDTSGTDTFEYYYYNGTAWVESDETQIDNLQYNDITTGLVTLSANKHGVHWVYKGTNSNTYVLYGQDEYTLSEAQAAQPPSSLPSHVEEMGALRAKIIIDKSDSVFTEIENVLDVDFQGSAASDHNESTGLQGGVANEYYHLSADEYENAKLWQTDLTTLSPVGSETKTNLTPISGVASYNIGGNNIAARVGATANYYNYFFGNAGNETLTQATCKRNIGGGDGALFKLTTGVNNVVWGAYGGYNLTIDSYNMLFGSLAGFYLGSGGVSNYNVVMGELAGAKITGGTTNLTMANNSMYLGASTRAKADGASYEIVIGNGATGNGSNTTTIGGSSNTGTYLTGGLYIKEQAAASTALATYGQMWQSSVDDHLHYSSDSVSDAIMTAWTSDGDILSIVGDETKIQLPIDNCGLYADTTRLVAKRGTSYFLANGGNSSSTGGYNVAINTASLLSLTTGAYNIAIGYYACDAITSGSNNIAIGSQSLGASIDSEYAIGVGHGSLFSMTTGRSPIAIGRYAGRYAGTGTSQPVREADYSIFIGESSRAKTNTSENEIVIGYDALGNGDNTITLGNTSNVGNYTIGDMYFKEQSTKGTSPSGYGQLWQSSTDDHLHYNSSHVDDGILSAWERSGTDDIKYVDGNVGFGDISATEKVDVDGVIAFENTSDPTEESDKSKLFAKDIDSSSELFAQNEAGDVTQLTGNVAVGYIPTNFYAGDTEDKKIHRFSGGSGLITGDNGTNQNNYAGVKNGDRLITTGECILNTYNNSGASITYGIATPVYQYYSQGEIISSSYGIATGMKLIGFTVAGGTIANLASEDILVSVKPLIET